MKQDNIQQLFSSQLENHTTSVRPEVWNSLQSKMAVAGITSVAATKGVSLLAKWIIGSAAITGTAVITTIALVNQQEEQPTKQKEQIATISSVATQPQPSEQEVIQKKNENKPETAFVFELPEHTQGNNYPGYPYSGSSSENSSTLEMSPDPVPVIADPIITPDPNLEEKKNITDPVKTEPGISDRPIEATVEVNAAKITKVPNVFTPNGDRENDYFLIESQNLENFSITIMNKQNQTVFKSTDPHFQWDGTGFDGNPLPVGNYVCIIVAEDSNGKAIADYKYLELRR